MEEIKEIGKCEICFEEKATYSYYKQEDYFMCGTSLWRALVCSSCLRKIRTGEIKTK